MKALNFYPGYDKYPTKDNTVYRSLIKHRNCNRSFHKFLTLSKESDNTEFVADNLFSCTALNTLLVLVSKVLRQRASALFNLYTGFSFLISVFNGD